MSSAEPDTVTALQPNPSSTNAIVTAVVSCWPNAITATQPARIPQPSRIVGTRPQRSASRPNTGESAYMPAMCRLMVSPTMVSVAPWCSRWIGVIAMIDTITPWAPTTARVA